MKKNFFKKLSFVLALAMIVSVLAPAAGAFAAKAPKLNASTKYLYLGVDGKDEFDFNISNKAKGWKYKWSSANADVASVNKKNGVTTATGAGTTKISVVITDKDGEEVDELKATVTVRDNIKELTITNLPADGKVAVGVAHDFNRSYVTVANKTKGSKAITRWSVDPSEDATITDSGVFTANKAGEYTITARAFQSKAKYTSWLSDATKYASYVTAEATYKVSVAASMVSAKQTTLAKFDLQFDSPMVKADVEKNMVVSYMAGTTKVKQTVKSVTMSTDNKTATVEMYLQFEKGVTYVVDYTGMKSVEFVSATAKVADVVDMAIITTTAQLSKAQKIEVALYNKDGVNIADKELLARTTTKSSNTLATVSGRDSDNYEQLYMYKVGETTTLTATFHTFNYDNAGKELGVLTATGVVTCVEQSKDVIGALSAYTVTSTGNSGNFKDARHSVFKGESALELWVKFQGKDANGNDKTTTNEPGNNYGNGSWTYTSSDTNVIIVNGRSIWAANEGTAVVVVKYDNVQVAACEITVTGARKVASVILDTNSIVISDNPNFVDTKTVGLTVKDQLGNKLTTGYKVYVEPNVTSATATTLNVNATTEAGAIANATSITFTPNTSVVAGTYSYTVTVVDTLNNNAKTTSWIGVEVKETAANATVSYYRIESDKSSYDMKVTTTDAAEDVILSLYGYTSDGVRLTKENINNLPSLTIKDGKGNDVAASAKSVHNVDSLKVKLIDIDTLATVSGTGINLVKKQAIGTYVVTATSGTPINAISFGVEDSQPAVSVTVNKTVTNKTTILDAINDCFDFTLDGSSKDLQGDHIDYLKTTYNTSPNAQIEKVWYYETLGANTIKHEVDMKNIVIKYAQ